MRSLLIDTNVVIDLLAKREPFYSGAAQIFSLSDKHKVKLAVNALTFANTNYLLAKWTNHGEARAILRKFRTIVDVLSLSPKVIDLTLNDDNFTDFEDGLQYYSAIENDIDIIITRNQKDYKPAKVPVMSPAEFLISGSNDN